MYNFDGKDPTSKKAGLMAINCASAYACTAAIDYRLDDEKKLLSLGDSMV
jgi:hypothetical protein